MIRFRNPGTQYSTQVQVFKELFNEYKNAEYFTLDDMAMTIAKCSLMTAYGYAGEQALSLSNTDNDSLNSTKMNAKMYAEVFRLLGWITSYGKSSYPLVFTYIGEHAANADDVLPLYEQCVLGINNPQEIMGMDAHHEWVLHGPFLDKTLIRNYMCYNLAGQIMSYAPNVRFCEVLINGEYNGLYLMVESITAGNAGARLDIKVDRKDNSYSGYVIRLDRGSETPIKNIVPFSLYSMRKSTGGFNIIYPGTANLNEQLVESITQDFSNFEHMLYTYDFDHSEYGYSKTIDVDSFVNYFLINEFTSNYDAGNYSTYIYKGTNGKYRMCVWDFNNAFDNYQEQAIDHETFLLHESLWFNMIIKDKDFTERVIKRYHELRKTYFSDDYLNNYIDETIAYLGDAIDRNFEKWGYTFESDHNLLYPTTRNLRSYDEAVAQLKGYIASRGAWMDENIDVLRQYSANSKTKLAKEHTR